MKPGLGAMRLDALEPHIIQSFYNGLLSPKKKEKAFSPKTVKNTHGVLHKALQQAVSNGYIRINPTDACVLPRVEKKQIQPLDEDQITKFLRAIKGHQFEDLFLVTLFTGMRAAEALGLTWECVNLENSTITINKQLQTIRGGNGECRLAPTKNNKSRTVSIPPFVVDVLQKVKLQQEQNRQQYDAVWDN